MQIAYIHHTVVLTDDYSLTNTTAFYQNLSNLELVQIIRVMRQADIHYLLVEAKTMIKVEVILTILMSMQEVL